MTWHEQHVVQRIIDQCDMAQMGLINDRRPPRNGKAELYITTWFEKTLRETEHEHTANWDTREHISEAAG